MALRRVSVLVLGMFLALAASGLSWAGETSRFETALDERALKVFLSPSFARDGTAIAFVRQPSSGLALYRSRDAGKTWEEMKWLVDNTYREGAEIEELRDLAWLPDGSVVLAGAWAKGKGPFLWVSRNAGERWESVNPSPGVPLNVEAAGNRLLGAFGPLYGSIKVLKVSEDGGRSWPYDVGAGVEADGRCLAALSEKEYFAVMSDYSLRATADGGNTWRDTGVRLSEAPDPAGPGWRPGVPPSMLKSEVVAVQEASGAGTVVACSPGTTAGVFVSRDRGVTWKSVDKAQFEWRPKHTASSVLCVAAAPGGLIFAGTPDDCVLVSEDYGATWKPVTGGIFDEVLDIGCAPVGDSTVVLAATQNGLLRMEYRKQQTTEAPEQQAGEEKRSEEPLTQSIKFVVGQKTYYVGGQLFTMDAETFTENGRTYVPVRYLGNALGAEIKWDEATQTVTLVKGGATVRLVVGERAINVNGQAGEMDVAPLVRDGRTYLPARYVAEAFGYRVSWDPATQSVSVMK